MFIVQTLITVALAFNVLAAPFIDTNARVQEKRASKQHSLQFTSYADHEVEDKASAPYEIQTSIRARDIEDRVFDELAFDERAFDELELAARNPDLQDNERRFIGLILAGVRAGIQAGIRAGVRAGARAGARAATKGAKKVATHHARKKLRQKVNGKH